MNRPAIPTEIRRRVLLEAGHRCAIPHCSHSQVDVHHIIPWEKCKEHSPENLIALCPNCHKRAGKGEIDRKSLIQYKLRGQKILAGALHTEVTSGDPWVNRTFEEKRDSLLKYEVEIEFPQFKPEEYPWAFEVNAHIQSSVFPSVQGIRNLANEAPWTWDAVEADEGESSLGSSYEVTFFSNALLSIRFSFFAYHYGAAHSNHWTQILNLHLDPVYTIELKHFFSSDVNYLNVVSKILRGEFKSLSASDDSMLNDAWMLEGTEPKKENFSKFNFTNSGLLFTFDEYSVAPFAAGRQELLIPFNRFEGIVLPPDLIKET